MYVIDPNIILSIHVPFCANETRLNLEMLDKHNNNAQRQKVHFIEINWILTAVSSSSKCFSCAWAKNISHIACMYHDPSTLDRKDT